MCLERECQGSSGVTGSWLCSGAYWNGYGMAVGLGGLVALSSCVDGGG
jgi:hypothetical protein